MNILTRPQFFTIHHRAILRRLSDLNTFKLRLKTLYTMILRQLKKNVP
jgi:hypothetical protein